MKHPRLSLALLLGAALLSPRAASGQNLVDLSWEPAAHIAVVGNEVHVDLVATSDGATDQPFGGLDAIMSWDPAVLSFIAADVTPSPYAWFVTGFLPDPDGINTDTTDGEALFTALAQLVLPAVATPPPPGLLVVRMRFTALVETPQTFVSFTANQGTFGSTRVIDFFQPGVQITGDISSQAEIRIVKPPQVVCTAKVNSLGCLPMIASSGTPSATSPLPFTITATMILNFKNGLFFYNYTGAANLPFFGGTLCAQPPLRRTGLMNSGGNIPPTNDCSGNSAFPFNALIQGGMDPLLVPGLEVNCQYWSRDPQNVDGTGVGLTDAVQFVIAN